MQYGTSRLSRAILTAQSRSIPARRTKISAIRRHPFATEPAPLPSRQWSTPLAKTIANAIEVTGPISIAAYMRQCLTNPDGGYYMTDRSASDQFGKRGDFITSPEISQIFGELVGIWFMTEWMSQGRPQSGVQFVEVGPGRGTLMADVLRTIGQFRSFTAALEAVWLVEAGGGLRDQQRDLLCGADANMKEVRDDEGRIWWESSSKYGNGIPVRWVEDVALLPSHETDSSKMPLIIAHEFFDALPIHAFESVPPDPNAGESNLLDQQGNPMLRKGSASKVAQWRELLVTPTKRKFTIPTPTGEITPSSTPSQHENQPDFQLTLAKASNPSSLILPENPRYRQLKSKPGSRIEISPESTRYIQDFARRIGGKSQVRASSREQAVVTSSKLAGAAGASSSSSSSSSSQPPPSRAARGAALIIDYGPLDTVPIDSLRGIKAHSIISPFLFAGQADISADVDFTALADAAIEASDHVEVHGPVEQGMWLIQLGIKERAERLLRSLKEDEKEAIAEKRKEIESGWKRLVEGGPKGMGKAYKVMSIIPENGGKRRPVGFGGDVAV